MFSIIERNNSVGLNTLTTLERACSNVLIIVYVNVHTMLRHIMRGV